MPTSYSRIGTYNNGAYRSQKSDLFQKSTKLSDWQAHWTLYLCKFDIKLQHLPGHKLILLDTLSRRLDHCPDDEIEEQILLSKGISWILDYKNK